MATIRALSRMNPVAELVLSQFEEHSPVFNDIDAYTAGGNADSLKKHRDGIAQTSIFREINNPPSRDKTTIDEFPIAKKIISGHTDIDKVYEDRNVDVMTELEFQTRQDAEVDAKMFHEKAWFGDSGSDSKEFDGIINLVPAARDVDLADELVLPVGGDASKAQQQTFFEEFIASQHVMPWSEFHCYMNEHFRLRMLTAAKNLGYYDRIQTPDGVIERIGKAIIRGYGYDASGDLIMPTVDGVGDEDPEGTTSFTYVKWGERTNLTFVTSAGLVADFNGMVDKRFFQNSWDLDGAFGLQNNKALYKLNGFGLKEPTV